MKTALIGLAAGLAAVTAYADFTGPYAHGNWTLELRGGDGGAATGTDSLVLTGADNGVVAIATYTIVAPGDGTLSFDWSFAHFDFEPRWDTGGYIVGGVVHLLSYTDGESGSVSVPVQRGDRIGFFVDTSSGTLGEGELTITNFSGPAASGDPLGACCLVQPGCVQITAVECTRRGGTYLGDGTPCQAGSCPTPPGAAIALAGDAQDLSLLHDPNVPNAWNPVLAYNSQDDEFALVWEESTVGTFTSIIAQRVAADGVPVGGPTVMDTPGFQITPSVAYNSVDNEYLVGWRSQSGAPQFNSSAGMRLAADLAPLGGETQWSLAGVGFEGSIVHNPAANEYFLTARRFSPRPAAIYGSRIAGGGAVLEPNILIDDVEGISFSGPAPTGQVAFNPLDNQYLSTYAVQGVPTWSAFNVRGRLIDASGAQDGGPFEISFVPHARAFYQAAAAAFDPVAGRYLVVFGDAFPNPIRGQFVGRDGTLLGHPFALTDPLADDQIAPNLAFDPVNGVYLLVWGESDTNTPTSILAQLLDADGSPLGAPVTLATTAQFRPQVAANSTQGGFLVAWRDLRNQVFANTADIYGQAIAVVAACLGDADGDGEVGLDDLLIVLGNFGGPGGQPADGDIDADGDVDLDDLLVLLGRFGVICP